jgi:hypothetical protein
MHRLHPGHQHYSMTTRLLACACLGVAAPILAASVVLGMWLDAAERSRAAQITLLCVCAAAAFSAPALLAFCFGLRPQAAAMRLHAESLTRVLRSCAL